MSDGDQRRFTMEEVAQMRAELSSLTIQQVEGFKASWGIPEGVVLEQFVKQQEEKFKPVATPPQRATVGRILHVFNPKRWDGPRPGIVVGGPWGPPESQVANVNVFLDGLNDGDALSQCRTSPAGNTLGSIPVRDPLTAEQRAVAGWEQWAEFPPRV